MPCEVQFSGSVANFCTAARPSGHITEASASLQGCSCSSCSSRPSSVMNCDYSINEIILKTDQLPLKNAPPPPPPPTPPKRVPRNCPAHVMSLLVHLLSYMLCLRCQSGHVPSEFRSSVGMELCETLPPFMPRFRSKQLTCGVDSWQRLLSDFLFPIYDEVLKNQEPGRNMSPDTSRSHSGQQCG